MFFKLQNSIRQINNLKPLLVKNSPNFNLFQTKRWSGHNNMNIEPSNFGHKYVKNMLHFYSLMAIIPVFVVTTIINIRSNAELAEIPEGYEPRHWEYYKHPITRFFARYMSLPLELEEEMFLAEAEKTAENVVVKKIEQAVNKTMSFYNDHRTSYWRPKYGEYVRAGRENAEGYSSKVISLSNRIYNLAYDKTTPVPVEGYGKEASMFKDSNDFVNDDSK